MAIATVLSITGQAWARDADGNLRELSVGDTLVEGETLVTSDNGSVQLDFLDGLDPTTISGGQEIAMTPEVDADAPVDAADSEVMDADLEALLAAIDDDDVDLLDVLDATAAGAGGGAAADGGHGFVRLARITEGVDPLAFEFGTAQGGEFITAQGEPAPVDAVEESDEVVEGPEEPEEPEAPVEGNPTAGPASISLAESGLVAGGQVPINGDQPPIDGPIPMALSLDTNSTSPTGFTSVTATGTIDFSFGPLGAGNIGFAGMDGETLSIGQESFNLDWDAASNTLTASNERVQGSNPDEPFLFQIQIDPQTGEFTITLANNLLHEEGTEEALANLVYTVTDAGGNTASSNLSITILDDAPSVDVFAMDGIEGFTLTTSDADLTPLFGGGEGEVSPEVQEPRGDFSPQLAAMAGNPEQVLVNTRDLSKFFGANVQAGADGLGSSTWSYSLSLNNSGETSGPLDSGLESGGNTVYLHEVEGPNGSIAIIGSTDPEFSPDGESAPNSLVFALYIAPGEGGYTITLEQFQAIDHPEGIEPGQSISLDPGLITLGAELTVVDNDGDVASDSISYDLSGQLQFVD
ncbi:hypothetical protein SAMN05192555_1291, partial [Franzmannia pantelleriensis]